MDRSGLDKLAKAAEIKRQEEEEEEKRREKEEEEEKKRRREETQRRAREFINLKKKSINITKFLP